ncbi:uncharacterized protein LOC119686461 [Teleopsis dalmanni]|uniref:uncharacterized protein LOC119665117 n=1 Tax=Teleopsis dalmanni TaxID=139649 RepID=UPI0018CEF181|nr:uncharacterized protein LOC119665117 [Teleopsis dalmanni]XP_037956077.1 uncharacterized protein LOC119685772 [Teleopsis dalmanni]XP_037956971.1 uncharacterized protein LOC119686459 [Teleopsis dalmanni]XP_037956972.1 uncharacterized protein LOC119686461 [Teleopsis dalmanni]
MSVFFRGYISIILFCGLLLFNKCSTEDVKNYEISLEYKGDAKKSNLFKLDFQKGVDKISASVNLLVELTNDDTIECQAFKDTKLIYKLSAKGICDFLKSHYKNFFYDSLKNYSNAPTPETCPLPKQKYQLNNYPLKESKIMKFMKPGLYDIKCIIHKGDNNENHELHAEVKEK